MANMASGSKRSWDAAGESRDRKRPRDETRDWRDVHLRSNSSRASSSNKNFDRDRRSRHDSERRRRSREHGRPRREREGSRDRKPELFSHSRHHTPGLDDDEREEGE